MTIAADRRENIVSELLTLVPLAIAVAVLAAVIWFLVSRDIGAGRWLLAAFLLGHGWVHMMFVMARPPGATESDRGAFEMARSWLISGPGIDPGAIRAIGTVLVVMVTIGYVLAGLATVGVLVPVVWWPGLVVASTIGSLVVLGAFLAPTFLIGFAIDAALLALVLAAAWTPAATLSVGGTSG